MEEFLRRVAQRGQFDPAAAEHNTTAVFTALGRALDDHAYDRLVARLPKNFAPMLPRGPCAGAVPVNEFLRNVAGRADTDAVDAQRGAEAVLETLAQRIGGQADDLMAFLPVQLHAALKRGRAHPDPEDLTVEAFLAQIASPPGPT